MDRHAECSGTNPLCMCPTAPAAHLCSVCCAGVGFKQLTSSQDSALSVQDRFSRLGCHTIWWSPPYDQCHVFDPCLLTTITITHPPSLHHHLSSNTISFQSHSTNPTPQEGEALKAHLAKDARATGDIVRNTIGGLSAQLDEKFKGVQQLAVGGCVLLNAVH